MVKTDFFLFEPLMRLLMTPLFFGLAVPLPDRPPFEPKACWEVCPTSLASQVAGPGEWPPVTHFMTRHKVHLVRYILSKQIVLHSVEGCHPISEDLYKQKD